MKLTSIALLCSIAMIGCTKASSPTADNDDSIHPYTALFALDAAEEYAHSLHSEFQLQSVSSQAVNSYGTSLVWTYTYVMPYDSAFTTKFCYLSSDFASVRCDSIVVKRGTVGNAVISQPWMNSTTAIAIAERNGGSNFTVENPNRPILASLGEACIPNSCPSWYITYTSTKSGNKSLTIGVNAVTGALEHSY